MSSTARGGKGLGKQEKGFNCASASSRALLVVATLAQHRSRTQLASVVLRLRHRHPHCLGLNSSRLQFLSQNWNWNCYECKLKVYKSNKFHLSRFNFFCAGHVVQLSLPFALALPLRLPFCISKIFANCCAFSESIFNAKCTIWRNIPCHALPPRSL